ncbi:MAG: hypothetical protein JNG88_03975 [Phycisphaerales bacterium]|nr:hypothetical protein [Phycisphaerales bacterium]
MLIRHSMLLAFATASAVGNVFAQVGETVTPIPASSAPQTLTEPVWLRATADKVNIRSRADANSIVMGQVDRDTALRADRIEFGWYRILPPEGTFCYVAAEYVEAGSGNVGTVKICEGTLRVRAGSTVRDINPVNSDVLARLNAGMQVQVLGREGDWLRMVPPADVRLYISDKFVERIGDDQAVLLRKSVRDAAPTPMGVRPPAAPTDTPSLVVKPDPASGPWSQRLAGLESKIDAESRKPAAQQNWTDISRELQQIAVQAEDKSAARLAQAWMTAVQQRISQREALAAIEAVVKRDQNDQRLFEMEMDRLRRIASRGTLPPMRPASSTQPSTAVMPSTPATTQPTSAPAARPTERG